MTIRERQKARTRQEITDAAAELLAEGVDPSIDEIAARAQISRATVYRYFGSASDIVWSVMSDRSIEPADEVAAAAGDDPTARVLAAERVVNDYLFGDPIGVRRFELSAIQRVVDGTAQPTDRQARRLRYIDAAIAPIVDELGPERARRLRHGLALAIGSESVVALIDACGLDDTEARDVTAWVCQALVAAVQAEASGDSS